MRRTGLAALAGATILTAAFATGAAPAETPAAQIPDLSGTWGRSDVDAVFLPPKSGQGGLVDDPAHPHAGHQNGQAAPFVARLPEPLLQPWVAAIVQRNHDQQLAGVEMLPAHSLCWPSGVPGALRLRENVEFLQTPTDVTILYQRDHQVRHISLGQGHSKSPDKSWYGESVGRYEGDTLVVDTIGMNDKSTVDWYLTPHSDQIHTEERYRVIDGGRTLEVEFTVTDPGAFTRPWSGIVHYRRANAAFEEIVCAENNKDISTGKDFPVPVAARADF